MKKILSLLFALIGWFAVITQYILILENSELSFVETTIRFFSYFTILTNIIVAVYFTDKILKKPLTKEKPGILTAITIYILIVGLVYQFFLRSTWNPIGLQKIADELLHSVIPVLVVIYWYLYENKNDLNYSQIPGWAIYPLLYLAYILIRGNFSGFYPYPFVNVTDIGYPKVLINSFFVSIFFLFLAVFFIRVGKFLNK